MPTAVERLDRDSWSLAGSVMTGPFEPSLSQLAIQANLPQLRRTGSLTVIHPFGPVSSQIRDAMLKKTFLPKVGIETPYYTVTLTNAQITNVGSYHAAGGGSHSEGRDTFEQEEIKFIFEQIDIVSTHGGKSMKDDWNAQT